MTYRGLLSFALLVSSVFIAAVKIDGFYHSHSPEKHSDMPVFMKILGEGRDIASNMAYLRADLYYHRGVDHDDHEHRGGYDHECSALENGHKDERSFVEVINVAPYGTGILLGISNELCIAKHQHLNSDNMQEIIPWLYYAMKLDPHNVDAYLITAYFLANHFNRTPEAVKLLRQGIFYNPDSWELYFEMGMIYFRNEDAPEKALAFLDQADRLLDNIPHDRFDKRKVLTPKVHILQGMGEDDKAEAILNKIKEIFPYYQSPPHN